MQTVGHIISAVMKKHCAGTVGLPWLINFDKRGLIVPVGQIFRREMSKIMRPAAASAAVVAAVKQINQMVCSVMIKIHNVAHVCIPAVREIKIRRAFSFFPAIADFSSSDPCRPDTFEGSVDYRRACRKAEFI